ncbi:MAG TPA: hypothetical protein VK689_14705, partial [Armatimonadota bacterium]|nr:hypothetical protein [Armatimonadota bacterium]
LLLRAGCPAAASDYFTSGIRRTPAADELVPLLQGRGWAWQCLGKPDAAARDFRRALKLARTLTDGRPEVEVLAALAAVESRRARAEDNSARGTRARAMVDRTGRLSRKFRDSHLDRVTPPLLAWAESGDADAGAGVPPTVPEAVQALVQLASGTECLPVVDASVREVERLIQLPEGEPPYHCPLSLLEVAY